MAKTFDNNVKLQEMTYEEFKERFLKKGISFEGDGGLSQVIKDMTESTDGFKLYFQCKKCGSMNVEIYGEDGLDYGGYTGYSPGSNVIKCKGCGNAKAYHK